MSESGRNPETWTPTRLVSSRSCIAPELSSGTIPPAESSTASDAVLGPDRTITWLSLREISNWPTSPFLETKAWPGSRSGTSLPGPGGTVVVVVDVVVLVVVTTDESAATVVAGDRAAVVLTMTVDVVPAVTAAVTVGVAAAGDGVAGDDEDAPVVVIVVVVVAAAVVVAATVVVVLVVVVVAGASGVPADGADGVPPPTVDTALILTAYDVPFVNPEIRTGEDVVPVVVHVPPFREYS